MWVELAGGLVGLERELEAGCRRGQDEAENCGGAWTGFAMLIDRGGGMELGQIRHKFRVT